MTATCRLSADGRTIIVDLPIAFRRIGGRKQVIMPDGHAFAPTSRPRIDAALVKALARAFRWRKLLETGRHATVEELAAAEKINASYVSRVLRLTLLAPCPVPRSVEFQRRSAVWPVHQRPQTSHEIR